MNDPKRKDIPQNDAGRGADGRKGGGGSGRKDGRKRNGCKGKRRRDDPTRDVLIRKNPRTKKKSKGRMRTIPNPNANTA
jgi:hypothetical protein